MYRIKEQQYSMKVGSNRKIDLWILINQVGICQDNKLILTRRMGARSFINKILAIFYQTFDSIICNNLHANYMNLSFDGLRCGAFCYKSCAWLIYLCFSFSLFLSCENERKGQSKWAQMWVPNVHTREEQTGTNTKYVETNRKWNTTY